MLPTELGRDPVGQVLDVDVAELAEDEVRALVQRIVAAEGAEGCSGPSVVTFDNNY
jgi:hypothetical protein